MLSEIVVWVVVIVVIGVALWVVVVPTETADESSDTN